MFQCLAKRAELALLLAPGPPLVLQVGEVALQIFERVLDAVAAAAVVAMMIAVTVIVAVIVAMIMTVRVIATTIVTVSMIATVIMTVSMLAIMIMVAVLVAMVVMAMVTVVTLAGAQVVNLAPQPPDLASGVAALTVRIFV
jgi:hypothetical protein